MADEVLAWQPGVPGIREVLHARFDHHAYPAHVHDDWTVLLIDDGAVAYDLDRRGHIAAPPTVTLLPPGVPHDGRSAIDGIAFRKRVLYLDPGWVGAGSADAAARRPTVSDPAARAVVTAIHDAVLSPGDALAAESGVLALREIVRSAYGERIDRASDAPLARRLRTLLDDRLLDSFTLAEAGRALGAHPGHLVRVFTQAYGIAPHHYVTGRRVDRARRLLGGGHSGADAAAASGFHDQAHMTRHFRRILGTSPGTFAARPAA